MKKKTLKKTSLVQLGVMLSPLGLALINSPIANAQVDKDPNDNDTIGGNHYENPGNLCSRSDYVWARNHKTGAWCLPMKGDLYQYCLNAGLMPSNQETTYNKVMKDGYKLDKVSNVIACGLCEAGRKPIYPDFKYITPDQQRLVTQLAVWKVLGEGNHKELDSSGEIRDTTVQDIIDNSSLKDYVYGLIDYAGKHQANEGVLKVAGNMTKSSIEKEKAALQKEANEEAQKAADSKFSLPKDIQEKAKNLIEVKPIKPTKNVSKDGNHEDDEQNKMHIYQYNIVKNDPVKTLGKDYKDVTFPETLKVSMSKPLPEGTKITINNKQVKISKDMKDFEIPFGTLKIEIPYSSDEGEDNISFDATIKGKVNGKPETVTKSKEIDGYDGNAKIYYKAVPDSEHQSMGVIVTQKLTIKPIDLKAKGSATPNFSVTDKDPIQLNWEKIANNGFGGNINQLKPGRPKRPTPTPKIHTMAYGTGGTDYLLADKISETNQADDYVYYEGLTPGKEYEVDGNFKIKSTGEDTDLKGTNTFKADKDGKGVVKVDFKGDASKLAGQNVVAFEAIKEKDSGKIVAIHADLNDENQTLHIPKLRTLATVDGKKTYNPDGTITIIDKVQYDNFKPNEEVTLKGQMMNKDTKEAISKLEGVKFKTNSKGSGVAEVKMTVDANKVGPNGMVAFEKAYVNNKEGKEVLVAQHTDFNDKGQTVTPKPIEKAYGSAPQNHKTVIENIPVVHEHKLIETAEQKIKSHPAATIMIAGLMIATIGGTAYIIKKHH